MLFGMIWTTDIVLAHAHCPRTSKAAQGATASLMIATSAALPVVHI